MKSLKFKGVMTGIYMTTLGSSAALSRDVAKNLTNRGFGDLSLCFPDVVAVMEELMYEGNFPPGMLEMQKRMRRVGWRG